MMKEAGQLVEREIDVLIQSEVGPYKIKIAVEAKDEKRKLCITKFESILAKYFVEGGIKVQKVVVIARAGFTKSVSVRARCLHVDLFTLREAREVDWTDFFPQDAFSSWNIQVENVRLFSKTPNRALVSFSSGGDGELTCSHGTNFGSPRDFARHCFFYSALKTTQGVKLNAINERVQASGKEHVVSITAQLDHPHWITCLNEKCAVDTVVFDVVVRQLTARTVDSLSLSLINGPQIVGVTFIPPVTEISTECLFKAEVICSCCGESHGRFCDWVKRVTFDRRSSKGVKALSELRDSVRNSSTGRSILQMECQLEKLQLHVDGKILSPKCMVVYLEASKELCECVVKQHVLSSYDGDVKTITCINASSGTLEFEMVMPEGMKSKTIDMSIRSKLPESR
ncbi:MAG: hypothetical protein R3C01_16625 [Planctomycetaceae bacterium]